MRCRKLSVTVLVMAGVLGGGPRFANAAFPGRNGDIAFLHIGCCAFRIYLIGATDHERRPLTPRGLQAVEPSFSADGSRVAFVGGRDPNTEIYVIKASGGTATRLTNNHVDDYDPVFSPSGRRITFSRAGRIWMMRSDGTHQHPIAAGLSHPVFSPDGRSIVYVGEGDDHAAIFSMRADGTHARQITHSRRDDDHPDIAPDGQHVVFLRVTDYCCDGEIHVIRLDGTHDRTLTHGHQDEAPAFSPTGRKIVFDRARNATFNLFVMDANGRHTRQVTHSRDAALEPTWQPIPGS